MSVLSRAIQTAWRILHRDGLFALLSISFGHFAGKIRYLWYRQLGKRLLQEHLSGPAYIIISTIEWDFPYKQRPQHLAGALGKEGVACLYFAPFYHLRSKSPGSEVDTNVFVYYERGDLIERLNDTHTLMLLSTDNALEEDFVDRLKASGATIIYDYIDVIDDAISLQAIDEERVALHYNLLKDPEIICLASADSLYEDALAVRPDNVNLLTNGVDYEAFATVRRGLRRAPELASLPLNPCLIGYHGALAGWLDYGLINEVARIRQDAVFVLIGPDYDGSSLKWRQRMPENVFFLPAINYNRIPQVSVWFDVCLVPFTQSALTDAVSPLKLFEYLALGKPVIATDFAEVRKYAPILTVRSASEFAVAIKQAFGLTQDKAYIDECRAMALDNSWKSKAQHVIEIVEAKVSQIPITCTH